MKCSSFEIKSNGISYNTEIFIDGVLQKNIIGFSIHGHVDNTPIYVYIETSDFKNHQIENKVERLEFIG